MDWAVSKYELNADNTGLTFNMLDKEVGVGTPSSIVETKTSG